MPTLMTYAGPVDDMALGTRTGGIPLVPAAFDWPCCTTCAGPMMFIAQLPVDAPTAQGPASAADTPPHILSVFMCQNDPGLCAEWDPFAGGNRALVLPSSGLTAAVVPTEGETLSPETCGIDRTAMDGASYDAARRRWAEAHGRSEQEVLGQLGGVPSWLQADETPACRSCGHSMGFVAQLEEGHDHRTALNFGGGGRGYAFACTACEEGCFLWQC
ncbi:DUF1963 domain-containing protein [Streptomyces sp. NPDC001796]|uniref:DUF1963 domain-containing protein n=1 Tax=Streptomyces sp. NPDC001796 TaxID=3364609 RepID=UPI0036CC3F34